MNRYAVSLLFQEYKGSNIITKIRSAIVKGESQEEAFGVFYTEKIKDECLKNASLLMHTVLLIEDAQASKNETT